jgi:hypothetical protein
MPSKPSKPAGEKRQYYKRRLACGDFTFETSIRKAAEIFVRFRSSSEYWHNYLAGKIEQRFSHEGKR